MAGCNINLQKSIVFLFATITNLKYDKWKILTPHPKTTQVFCLFHLPSLFGEFLCPVILEDSSVTALHLKTRLIRLSARM